ncbi:hypothetical protein AgCh_021589 [Apium graveolens]
MEISKHVVITWGFLRPHYTYPASNTTYIPDPSYPSSPSTCDVFLSFYGKHTRNNFTSDLYSASDQARSLSSGDDDPALHQGQEISSGLLNAIKHSKISIFVLSENMLLRRGALMSSPRSLVASQQKYMLFLFLTTLIHQICRSGKALDGHKKLYFFDSMVK